MALSDSEKKEILDLLKTESTDVTELETVSSLSGITSLPALQGQKLVSAPISLLSKPATDAATTANAAAAKAETSAKTADNAASNAANAASNANKAADDATAAKNAAEAVVRQYESVALAARKGAVARFSEIIESGVIQQMSSGSQLGRVVYVRSAKKFAYQYGSTLYNNWIEGNAQGPDMFLNEGRSEILKNKVYLCGSELYVWSDEDEDLVLASGSGSGSGFFNVTMQIPLSSGYYDKDTAVAAIASADIKDDDKPGMIMSFESKAGVWEDYRFIASKVADFDKPASWEEYGGGKIRSISLNGQQLAPDVNGNVAITIDQIEVDESLSPESTNPVQNAVITRNLNELDDKAIGGIEFDEDDGKTTCTILNKRGGVIASGEFSGGGGGGGGGTASKIIITANLDKAQVKEGGNVQLSYHYDHVNSEGEGDGIKADITITISRGSTVTYQQTFKNVATSTNTLDISKYLLSGTNDIYVKAVAMTAEGTIQTKQAYVSIEVVTLALTSSYNLASTIANGGYRNTDTIEIPFAITGTGTKEIQMYIDGAETPISQTITRAGTVNGSFTIQASSLSAGRHTIQLVAERSGLLSDSIYIDILKAGLNTPFIGLKYTDKTSAILKANHLTPTISAGQYEAMSFEYIAYDPQTTPASVDMFRNGNLFSTVSVPRSMQTYNNRFTERGKQTLMLKVGSTSYTLYVNVLESDVDLNEATFGLVAKLDAAGRSNGESNPGTWASGDISTIFEGFDWNSNGWTGEALKLTNGAKATINYQPFKTDAKATGLTIEITMKISNVMTHGAPLVSCIDKGKGLLITTEDASFMTGQSVQYTNEDDELVTREIKLGTNYVPDKWHKISLNICTRDEHRLMHLYVNGNRTGADIYDNSFSFQQETPQNIVIDSSEADIEIKSVRIYNRAISDDEELENRIVDAETPEEMMLLYDANNILGDTGGIDIDKILAQGKGVLRIVRKNLLDDVYETNDKKADFLADIYFYSPFGPERNFVLRNCYIRIQGTSSTKYPSKNLRIYFNKGSENLEFFINGVKDPFGKNKYQMRPGAIPMNLFCPKSDYSDSSMSLNTGGAKLFNDVMKELHLFTPPQRHQYENGGQTLSAVTVRTAIDGIPIDIFCSETEDSESIYYGQYNFNNEKSKSESLFGMTDVEGFNPTMPMTFEMLNNTAAMCLFKTTSDKQVEDEFDIGAETNYPDDVKWVGLTSEQQAAVKRLYGWIRDCVPPSANSNNLASFVSTKFVNEIDQYFDKDFILTYYLFTDYFLSVDQRAKNMMLRTWDGKIWYLTYYDGDTQLGKRNDCFLVYTYLTDRNTFDAEASKYAFEGRDSWLWNLVLANLQDDLKRCAANLRTVLTNERVLTMFNDEQSGHWADRAFNKSGELKYIKPAIQEMYGKIWPFIYALQGSNQAHREYFIRNRFALLDAKYGTSNFTSDNIDFYLARTASDQPDVIKITANEPYAFGYGTNNRPNLANTDIVDADAVATLSISEAYTVNDPLRLYGASRIKTLDLTGAADHLKNALDLGKCSVIRELNLQSSTTGSTGWWLSISNCRSLRRLILRNQQNAKTGSNTSTELDLTNQTKLEYLDARGTLVQSVSFAMGAPLKNAYLPRTLSTLRLEYLSQLAQSGLYMESYTNVQTFIFAGCPLLDWQTIFNQCTNLKRVRISGIDMEGDGSFLEKCMSLGGVDASGNMIDECALVGSYQLTKYLDEATYQKYVAHFPELTIRQPEYSILKQDEDVADGTGWTNLDNNTGYDFSNDFQYSGHIAKILSQRFRCLAKHTASKEVTLFPLHDKNSNYYADADDITRATPADLTGKEGDVMVYEPHYWYKGVNDLANKAKYKIFSSNAQCPKAPEGTKVTKEELTIRNGYSVRIGADYPTLEEATAAINNQSLCTVDIPAGTKQARFPSVVSAIYGGVFIDDSGNILGRVKATSDSGIMNGMYIFGTVPQGATKLAFSIHNNAPFDYVWFTPSDKIADIEPDWVEHTEMLGGAYEGLIRDDLLRSVSGVQSSASVTQPDFKLYAANHGAGYQLVDWEWHKDICNLFYAKYGKQDSQGTCGYGTNASNRVTGLTNEAGMTDTHALPTNTAENSAYIYTDEEQTTRKNIQSPNALGYENLWGNKAEWIADGYNTGVVDYSMHITMPDGSERLLPGLTTAGDMYPHHVYNGRYMDIWVTTAGGSTSSYYFDNNYVSSSINRVVYRSSYGAHADGGVACASANLGSAYVSAHIGSRLAFRGNIKVAKSVSEFKALKEVS